jgi:hypothetical protein
MHQQQQRAHATKGDGDACAVCGRAGRRKMLLYVADGDAPVDDELDDELDDDEE